MTMNSSKRRKVYSPKLLLVSIIIGLLVVAMGPIAQVFADESITVACYKLQDSEIPLGHVVVYDTSQAALACNSHYYDCKGRCVGCFTDQDYLDSVCVDVRGTMFLK